MAIVIFVLVGIITFYWFYQRKSQKSFSKGSQPLITTEKLLKQMKEFAQKGQYRYAVQKCFHFLLQSLTSKKNYIFAITKTNGEYRDELMKYWQPEQAKKFIYLSCCFDEVWYGEQDINLEDYLHYRQQVFDFLEREEPDEEE